MNPSTEKTNLRRLVVATVTVLTAGSTVSALIATALAAAGEGESSVAGWWINPKLSDGTTDRPLVTINGSPYAAGVEVNPPVLDTTVVVAAPGGNQANVVIEVYLK